MAISTPITPFGARPTFDLVDLNTHPDAVLLRACAQATALCDRLDVAGINTDHCPAPAAMRDLWHLNVFIIQTEAHTHLGLRMKALYAAGDLLDPMQHSIKSAPLVSVVRDFLRLGATT